jgi:hypothetical protein
MHTASVNPEPESNSFRKSDLVDNFLIVNIQNVSHKQASMNVFLFCTLDVKEHSVLPERRQCNGTLLVCKGPLILILLLGL